MEIINAALCSYGMSGRVFHGPLLEQHPGFRIKSIYERAKHESAGLHPGSELVRTYESILKDPAISLVIVNTPDHLHYEMVLQALKAGKHVVVEKPFTLKSSHAEELMAEARQRGLMLTVFQNRRWDGDFLTVKQILEKELLGRLVDFESHFDRYRTWIQESWKDRDKGTGTLYNLGSHLVDQALQLFGMPESLYCDSRMLRDGALTDDSFDLFLHYPDHKCLLRSSYLVREPGPRFILHGTEGSYLKWGIDPQEEALKQGGIPGSPGWGQEDESEWGRINTGSEESRMEGPYPTLAGSYSDFYDDVFEAITQGRPPLVDPAEALQVIRIIEAAYLSSEEKRIVDLS